MKPARRVRFADRVVYWIARAAFGGAARVPQWLGYRAADWLGRLWFRFDTRRRRYAQHFLNNAYPELDERQRLRIASAATGNLFKVPLDMARLTRLLDRGGDLSSVLDTSEGGPRLDTLTPPYLALTAHLGNWEVAAIGVARHAGSGHTIARVAKNPLLNRWILANRERGGLTIHPRRGGFRGLAAAMRQGHVGLQAVDQNQRLRGVFAPFFGELASCERAAVSLALRHGYPIIVGAALRVGHGFRFALVSAEPFVPERTGDKQRDLQVAVERVNGALEELIRRAPEQYLWIHDRYRTKPPDGGGARSGLGSGGERP